MCWNASISLNTYLFSLFASGLAWMNGLLSVYGFVAYQAFSTMQLIEYFTWSKTFDNAVLSFLALTLVLMQPATSILTMQSKAHRQFMYPLLVSYVAFVALLLWLSWRKMKFSMTVASNGHLSWKWLNVPLLLILLWLVFLVIPYAVTGQYFITGFIVITFAITYVLYSSSGTWGSLWCWVANFMAIGLLAKVFYKDICISK